MHRSQQARAGRALTTGWGAGAQDPDAPGPAVLEATDARIESFTLLSTRYEDGRAEVRTRLRVGARPLTTTLHLERRQDGAWPRPVWTLVPLTLPTVMVAIPVGTAELSVNGQRVTVPAESRPRGAEGLGIITLRLLPGLYEIEAPARDRRLDPVPARINVPPMLSPWTSVPLQAGYVLTDTGEQQLAGTLHDSLRECLRNTSPAPLGCPLKAPDAPDLTGSWRLITEPEVSVSAGWMGAFTLYARGGVAEFTVPAADGQAPRAHRVLLDARAMGALDREGEFVTSWSR